MSRIFIRGSDNKFVYVDELLAELKRKHRGGKPGVRWLSADRADALCAIEQLQERVEALAHSVEAAQRASEGGTHGQE